MKLGVLVHQDGRDPEVFVFRTEKEAASVANGIETEMGWNHSDPSSYAVPVRVHQNLLGPAAVRFATKEVVG